ncbi:MAG: tail fiber domain-containing protein, partial [Steroidobacteraceae bacterium]
SSGQLGTVVSSERFKTDIAPMASSTAKLGQLRPVKFKLKTDAEGTVQYGLVAEEVAKVYPELVIRGQNGRIDGVRYDELAPMLLNEMQKQQKNAATQAAKIAAEDRRAAAQDAKIASLEQQLAGIQAALVKLQPRDEFVAQR